MTAKKRLLLIADGVSPDEALLAGLDERFEVVSASSGFPFGVTKETEGSAAAAKPFSALLLLSRTEIGRDHVAHLLQSDRILAGMPDAAALLDETNRVIWANEKLSEWAAATEASVQPETADRQTAACGSIVGQNFYNVLGGPDIIGPDFCPFHTALSTNTASSSTLKTSKSQYFKVHAAPVVLGSADPAESGGFGATAARHLIVTVRDVTEEVLQNQKLHAIHQAGMDLAGIKPDELQDTDVEDRIDLLKSNILHYTHDLLSFDLIEIRLLDPKTGCLEPILSAGIDPKAAGQDIFAKPLRNGVTGFVAATGKSYLCEDTEQDPLYLQGAKGAKSSLTVPLILHDEVIGTFNVESTEPAAFSESDLQFLEIFAREVALALNTLDLLAAEQATTVVKSIEAIYSAVALPVDQILNDAASVLSRFIGHEEELTERLQRIFKNARNIKNTIQRVGEKFVSADEDQQLWQAADRPALQGCRVLVADEDDSVRGAAHELLEKHGCVVETAHNGAEAMCMLRNTEADDAYDCIIADIRLPDMSGYDFMVQLGEFLDPLPLLLMTGFGYDPGHSVVKARKAGLKAVLYKPFRLDQLLESVEMIVTELPVRQHS